jgi:beta-mannanase
MPTDCGNGGFGNVNNLGLPNVLSGQWDAYITQWATGIGELGYPVFVRWGHEMNIPSYSWGAQYAFGANGKTKYDVVADGCGLKACYGDPNVYDGPERYIAAYRHVHDLAAPNAPNIVWVWNPNNRDWPLAQDASWNQYNNYYPGDAYVDWIALDGYNWGADSGNGNGFWASFSDLFGAALNDLAQRHPTKPQMIAEFASVEDGINPNRKPDWIRDAYQSAMSYPLLRVLVWVQDNSFNDVLHHPKPVRVDFRVNSSDASLQAYRAAVAGWLSESPLR